MQWGYPPSIWKQGFLSPEKRYTVQKIWFSSDVKQYSGPRLLEADIIVMHLLEKALLLFIWLATAKKIKGEGRMFEKYMH